MGYLPYFHWLAGFSSINSMSKTFPFSISYVNSLCHGHRCLFQLLQHLVPQMLWILGAKKGSKTKKTGWLKSLTKNKEKCMWTDLQEIYSEVRLFVRTLKKNTVSGKVFAYLSEVVQFMKGYTHPKEKRLAIVNPSQVLVGYKKNAHWHQIASSVLHIFDEQKICFMVV